MKNFLWTFILAGFLSSTSFGQSLEPGQWKAKTTFKLNGIALPSHDNESCISAEEAKDAKATIASNLKKDGCDLKSWNVKNGKLEATLSCNNDDIEATGKIHGTFSKKSYSLEGEAEGLFKKTIPSTATLKLTGEWVKKCIK